MQLIKNYFNRGKPEEKGHVPYRNSKLTYLLQDALGNINKEEDRKF